MAATVRHAGRRAARAAGAAARPARRGRRPRRPTTGVALVGGAVALHRRDGRGDRLRRASADRDPRPRRRRRTARSTSCRTPRAPTSTTRLARARARGDAAAPRRRPRVLQLVPRSTSRSRSASATSIRPARRSSSRSSSTTTPRCGSTASCRSRSATPAAASSAASTRPTASCSRATRGPAQTFQIAVFGINGPISASPRNYIWMRSATLDVYAAGARRARSPASMASTRRRRSSTRSCPPTPGWSRSPAASSSPRGRCGRADGALLFSSPNTNAIYRWTPEDGSRCSAPRAATRGTDIGRYHQPGSNGLTFDPEGRLTICQHGNRRVIRVEPHGNITVLADALRRPAAQQPQRPRLPLGRHAVLHRPAVRAARRLRRPGQGARRSAASSRVRDGEVRLETDELAGPNGLAFSPDERYLYVGNWDLEHKVVMRYDVAPTARCRAASCSTT